jgi:hypothetical protein
MIRISSGWIFSRFGSRDAMRRITMLRYCGATDKGGRSNNEDAYEVQPIRAAEATTRTPTTPSPSSTPAEISISSQSQTD